jgi:branched-chain amino acid transport system substrate-binding protein
VITRTFLCKKAIPALLAGIAFLFPACYPRIPEKKELPKEILLDPLAQAETYRQRGRFAQALDAYAAFLKKHPEHERSALVLHRMAEIYLETGNYKTALDLLEGIPERYSGYEEIPAVHYQIGKTSYLLGEYQRSKDELLKWQKKYPRHSLMGDSLLLLGDTFKALGDNPQAFNWWLKANEAFPHDLPRQEALNAKLEELIEASKLEELTQLTRYAVETEYAPKVYHKIATIFLEKDELAEAREAAMALIHSTHEHSWVSLGQRLLEKIQDLLSVKKGVVGCLLPLSGPFAIYGEEVLNGIQLGMGISSNAGEGPGLELVIKDTQGKPEKALTGLEDLVNSEKVMAIIGPLSSKTASAVAPRAQELGVPIVTLTQKSGITEEGEMVFRNFLTPSQEVKRLLDMAMGEMGMRRFGILYPENSYGRFFMNLFWDRLEEGGGMVTAIESYNPETTDFAAQIKKMIGLYYPRPDSLVQKLREMWPPEREESEIYTEEPEPIIDFDSVFIPDNFQRVAMIAPQLVYHDIAEVLFMGTNLWQSPQLIEMAGDYVQGAIFSSGFFERLGDPLVNVFSHEYRSNFDASPGILAATGYDTIRLLEKVMAQEGFHTRKGFQKALLEYRDFEGITGKIFFDPQGEIQREPLLLTISGKRMVALPSTPIQ